MGKQQTQQTQRMEGFEELEAMVDAGLADKRERDAVRAAKDRIIAGRADAEQVAEDAARIRRWEAEHEYYPAALCLMMSEQECQHCGDFQYLLVATLLREEHRTQRGTRRWTSPGDGTWDHLPKEIMRDHRLVPMCGECCEKFGFSWMRSYYHGDNPEEVLAAQPQGEAMTEPTFEVPDATARSGEVYPGVEMTPWPFH